MKTNTNPLTILPNKFAIFCVHSGFRTFPDHASAIEFAVSLRKKWPAYACDVDLYFAVFDDLFMFERKL